MKTGASHTHAEVIVRTASSLNRAASDCAETVNIPRLKAALRVWDTRQRGIIARRAGTKLATVNGWISGRVRNTRINLKALYDAELKHCFVLGTYQ